MKTAEKALIVTILIFLIGGVGSAYAWMYEQRPIVDYYLAGVNSSPLEPTYYSFEGPMTVNLMVDNRGSIDASINLIVTVTNANITDSNVGWSEYNGTQATIGLAVQSHQPYGSVTVHIVPNQNVQSFTITYSVIDTHDWGIPNGLIDHIGGIEIHGYRVTATYNETNENTYQLLGSS